MKKYESPKVQLQSILLEDVITASGITFVEGGLGYEEGNELDNMFKL